MKKRGQYLLILGSAFALTASVAGGLTGGILRYNQTQRWKINPYESYDFEQAKNSLLEAKIPPDLVKKYIELVKKITGVNKTSEIIKASELLDLDNQMMNSVSQRMIWDQKDPHEIQKEINLAKPILIQFYEYYQQVYVYQNDLINDSLNQMQLKSANTDLYKWSIGTNISDYNLIKDYLKSAQEAWISKMKMSYIFEAFLNKKIDLYDSLIVQANDEIAKVIAEINQLNKKLTQLLDAKQDAQNHLIWIVDFGSIITSFEIELGVSYGLTVAASAVQLFWAPIWPIALGLALVTWGLGEIYSNIEKSANQVLDLQTSNCKRWVEKINSLSSKLNLIWSGIYEAIKDALTKALELAANIFNWIMAFIGIGFLTADFVMQTIMFEEARGKIGNPNSEATNAINSYIQELDQEMSEIAKAVDKLNAKEENYMNQKISFKSKLNELSFYNKFFQNFDQMNDEIFTQTNIFTLDQIKKWKNEVEEEYGQLIGNWTTNDFIEAFSKESDDFDNKYFDFQSKKKSFIDNYNNNDKEYFLKNLMLYIDNPLENNYTYFNNLDFIWDNYDDIFKELP